MTRATMVANVDTAIIQQHVTAVAVFALLVRVRDDNVRTLNVEIHFSAPLER